METENSKIYMEMPWAKKSQDRFGKDQGWRYIHISDIKKAKTTRVMSK